MADFQPYLAFYRGLVTHIQGKVFNGINKYLTCFKDYLRGEEREVNHHGRVRKLGGDGEKDPDNDEEDGPDVLHNNWVEEGNQLKLDLISRHEDVQVRPMTCQCL